MTTNAFAIARRLVDRGVDKRTADAVAEEIVTHSDENLATKTDIVRLEGKIALVEEKIETLVVQVKILTGLVGGLYIGLAVLFVDRIVG